MPDPAPPRPDTAADDPTRTAATLGLPTGTLSMPAGGTPTPAAGSTKPDGLPVTAGYEVTHEIARGALDVTFVICSDNPSNHNAKVLDLALASAEFYDRHTLANSVRESNQFATPHDTGDLTKGVVLARLLSDANDDQAEFTLRVE